eukprot:comp9714_c0_seq1/m.11294 comp9714_c0_seq1/g.11294  ORF comp9714_c0_seq1/g.11294 comp9714_c0_seq1/m.11294 type:complete len:270 (+) comp9714_c0_seq1:5-814(+)
MRSKVVVFLLFVLFSVSLSRENKRVSPVSCASFNPAQIRLVTFDLFAALADTMTSLTGNVARILSVSESEASAIATDWMGGYAGFIGHSFTSAQTKGKTPFNFVIQSTLAHIETERGLRLSAQQRATLIKSWGQLQPWQNTVATLRRLQRAGIFVAPLSNGDAATLSLAMKTFGITPRYVFGSDFPVGAFKPLPQIYSQVLSRSGLTASQVLHVAGSMYDAEGARAAGLFAAINTNGRHAGGASDPATAPCFELNDIQNVLSTLRLSNP